MLSSTVAPATLRSICENLLVVTSHDCLSLHFDAAAQHYDYVHLSHIQLQKVTSHLKLNSTQAETKHINIQPCELSELSAWVKWVLLVLQHETHSRKMPTKLTANYVYMHASFT